MPSILFSPVGGTDPISNDRDGSMLHIARKYHPEYIMLFLSSEILSHEMEDQRYTKTLRLLMEKEGFSAKIECVKRPELKNVQLFDVFIPDFEALLDRLHERFPDHELLLNISSGTPAMKSALNLLSCLLPYKVKPVQVSTPMRAQNPRRDPNQEYDVNLYWEFDLDNDPEQYVDRCEEAALTNYRVQFDKESIIAHLRAYDYDAAYRIAVGIRDHLGENVIPYLETAKSRIKLRWKDIPADIRTRLRFSVDSQFRTNLSEYLLWLKMKQERGDLADFLRGLTPAIFNLLRFAVEENGGVRLSDYCVDDTTYVSTRTLTRDEIGIGYKERYFDSNEREFTGGYLMNYHYVNVINALFSNRPWATSLHKLRKIEEEIRNPVAHTIVPVDEAWLKQFAVMEGKASGSIVKLIQQVVEGLNADSENQSGRKLWVYWNSYQEMNQMLLDSLR